MEDWELEIHASQVRVFAAAVQALASVGKEVYFAVDASGELILHALADSHASYGSFRFEPRFFAQHRVRRCEGFCKVVARGLMLALRRATLARNLLKVVLRHPDEPRLCVEVYHEDGVRVRWRLHYDETADAEEAAFDDDGGRVVAQPVQLAAVLEHVGGSRPVTLTVGSDSLDVHTHSDANASTSLSIAAAEFDVYETPPAHPSLTLNATKELRAAVKFCEVADAPDVRFQFAGPGQSVCFSTRTTTGCNMQFILSTARGSQKKRSRDDDYEGHQQVVVEGY